MVLHLDDFYTWTGIGWLSFPFSTNIPILLGASTQWNDNLLLLTKYWPSVLWPNWPYSGKPKEWRDPLTSNIILNSAPQSTFTIGGPLYLIILGVSKVWKSETGKIYKWKAFVICFPILVFFFSYYSQLSAVCRLTCIVLLPIPSWPFLLSPVEKTVPLSVKNKLWLLPVAAPTITYSFNESTNVGESLVLVSPTPNWPKCNYILFEFYVTYLIWELMTQIITNQFV